MDKVSASFVKQRFGDVLERAAVAPLGIEKHGKLVAGIVPAGWLGRLDPLSERMKARQEQRQVEQNRLMAHLRIGIELLSHPERKAHLLQAARVEIQRWIDQRLCSRDYIDRWTEWLALPDAELVERMCSDAGGWGNAMRQNSPFTAGY